MRKRGDFRKVFERGIRYSSKFLIMYALLNGLGLNRVGLSVSRKVGSAVVRNRIKRRLRESLKRNMREVAPGYDIVVISMKSAAEADYYGLNASVISCISGLVHEKVIHRTD